MKRVSFMVVGIMVLFMQLFVTDVHAQSSIKFDAFVPTNTPTPTRTPTPVPGFDDADAGSQATLPPAGQVSGCPSPSLRLRVPGTIYDHHRQQFTCFKPTMFVVHWSAAWTTAQGTKDYLDTHSRSCQLALDRNKTIQALDFYPKVVQRGWCAGNEYNNLSINVEISGVYFDEVITNPGHSRYQDLTIKSDKTVALICWSLKQYG
ncbi:N-acetylmuramoyl-L-alanine amidase, partial [Candidatus Roizmanbacteria bacterium]|nr:N-acetylmuramoyl-L-alanine amidase [Candidatus Roizmanbacteria bacterium]